MSELDIVAGELTLLIDQIIPAPQPPDGSHKGPTLRNTGFTTLHRIQESLDLLDLTHQTLDRLTHYLDDIFHRLLLLNRV